MSFIAQNIIPIIGIIILLLIIVIIFQFLHTVNKKSSKRVSKIVTVEGYSQHTTPGLFPDSANPQAICNIYLENPAMINKRCKTFSKNNCKTVDCCVWKNDTCVGGTDNRPFYSSNK